MKYRAIIIDDRPQAAFILEKHLKSIQHESVTVNNQEAAIKLLQEQEFDYALVDVNLTKTSRSFADAETGFETMRFIREHYPQMKIVAVTAGYGYETKAFESGADAFYEKSIDPKGKILQKEIIKAFGIEIE